MLAADVEGHQIDLRQLDELCLSANDNDDDADDADNDNNGRPLVSLMNQVGRCVWRTSIRMIPLRSLFGFGGPGLVWPARLDGAKVKFVVLSENLRLCELPSSGKRGA